MPPDLAVLVLTIRAAEVRRALPPSAWVVLEHLASAAVVSGEVETTSREIGRAVGLNKDTAASALQRLIGLGLVRRPDVRVDGSGRFGRSRYVADLEAAGLLAPPSGPAPVDTAHRDATSTRTTPAERTSHLKLNDPNQLTLIDP
jgi:hypothetical protein